MSRIPLAGVDQQPEPIRQWIARRGKLNVFRLLANAPQVFDGWTKMVDALFASPAHWRQMIRRSPVLLSWRRQGRRSGAVWTGSA
jgi:4-carboxymuconolactone decarboxylase